jgi:pSer/pThr/pTyr-binding forkhead associated (FHA) protein
MTDSEGSKPLPISIAADEITFGSDQDLATIVIQDDSVQGLHARLQCMENGIYLLSDQGSIAGTWVNYAQVPTEGQEIRHGDLIHLGRVGYRFKQRDAKNARLLVIRS